MAENFKNLNDELENQRNLIIQHLNAIKSLSKVYVVSYFLDVEKNEFYELSVNLDMKQYYKNYTSRGNAQQAFNDMCEIIVEPEYQKVMKKFTNCSTLSKRLSNKEYIVQRYKSKKLGWVQASFIVGERNKDGTVKSCTYVISDVNAQVAEEEKELKIFQALSSDYLNVFIIDSKTGTSRALSLENRISNLINVEVNEVHSYKKAFDIYIKEHVHPEDAEEMSEKIKLEHVVKKLKNKTDYNGNFRTLENDVVHHIRFKFRKISDTGIILLGFQNTDEIVDEVSELNDKLQKAIEEQESQIEEIKALNTELEDNQAELEASAAEQEAQIDEIQKLNHSLSEYNDAMSNAGYGMWHIILKEGTAPRMQVNQKMAELLGVAGKKLTDEEMYSAWHERIVPEALESVNKSVGEMMEGQFSENTYLWNHASLGNIYVRCGGTCVKLEDGTNILSGYHANVTSIVLEDKRREEELKEAQRIAEEEKTRVSEAYGMIEGLSQEYHTIWVVSKETSKMRLIRSSGVSTIKNAVQMGKDYPEFDAAFDKYINTYVEPEDRARMKKQIAFAEVLRQLEKNDFYSVNYLRRDDSGHVGYHQIAFSNADTKTGVKQFVYGFRDIDKILKEEQKKKEELKAAKEAAESANKAKTSFLFNMSHDIRTPMNAIIGFRDLLEKHQNEPEKRQDYLNKIKDSSTVLLSIINNVLEMARIEKGTLTIEETAWGADQFNDTLYTVFQSMMKEKGLKFTRQIEVQHPYVYCDSTKLREIFINILGNAYKYTNCGSVNMELKELPYDKEGWALYQTTITDTGIGMNEDFIPHIFEEFSREKNTTDAKIEGTGLGMPIVKRLIEMMDGTIEVKSIKGKGSTFIVKIPHRIADKSDISVQKELTFDSSSFKGKRILLAEDNDLNAEIAMSILSEEGFIVDRAEDGVVCVEMLKKAKAGLYDVILMDVQMPNLNGYEATKKIRALEDKEKASIKIIAMTANAFEEDRREALDAGMNGHVTKPINVNDLMRTLAGIL